MHIIKAFITIVLFLHLFSCSSYNNTLRVGTSANYSPLAFKDKSGQHTGLEIDYALALGKELNREVEFVEIPFDELINALNENKIDIIMSGMTSNNNRSFKVKFLPPYIQTRIMILIKKDKENSINPSLKEVSSELKIGYVEGSVFGELVKNDFPENPNLPFEGLDQAISALQSGEIDVFLHESPGIVKYAQSHKELIKMTWGTESDALAWAVDYGNGKLYNQVLDIYQKWKINGTLKQIRNKWVPDY
ncbi:ABC transporter substrate-binding protein [Lentisphaera profundi]|uniref:ABC transporter substrate-binding protein n=1 Tax=Lentisphaera profundi TaxID=1658616 RepID=A0ABY7VS25_9BACT|nr:ABC transporter substrate-binding protein [Lentisphaera profundi]WDE97010.1 ABC transporter substrate-binding protein [Lentisphaera profundi]